MSLAPISGAYASLLTPLPFFTAIGWTVSTLDLLATIRLCVIMRQIREEVARTHVGKTEDRSFTKHAIATLTVVYGGEALTAAWLGQSPSFILSGTFPILYVATQAIVEYFPYMPPMSFEIEGPITFLDALSRSYLLTDLIPPAVLNHTTPAIANSPWTLMVVSLITANAGFFFVNLASMFNPGGWCLATPAELRQYGWTTVDLWVAPLITGIVATLTHAQPFWTYLHLLIMSFGRPVTAEALEKNPINSWTIAEARSFGAVILWVLFATRTVKNFGNAWWQMKPNKKDVMRSRVDGKRYPSALKAKKME